MMVSGTSGITGVPASFSVYCAGNLLLHSALHPGSDFWTIVDVPVLPACTGQDAENTEFVLCCETQMPDGKMRPRVFIPDQYLGNGDPREMGIMVAAIRVI
jgi:hypothetical protein